MSELKKGNESLTNPKEKQILSKVIAGKIIKKYRLGKYAHQEFGFSQKMIRANQKRPSFLEYHRKQQSNVITNADEITLAHFLERDDNSRATTGKRDTITRKQLKIQKRLLSDSLKNLHLKFKASKSPTLNFARENHFGLYIHHSKTGKHVSVNCVKMHSSWRTGYSSKVYC